MHNIEYFSFGLLQGHWVNQLNVSPDATTSESILLIKLCKQRIPIISCFRNSHNRTVNGLKTNCSCTHSSVTFVKKFVNKTVRITYFGITWAEASFEIIKLFFKTHCPGYCYFRPVSISFTTLTRVLSYPYLGVELDSALSYDKHLDCVVNKTTHKLYTFRKIRRFFTQSTAIIVYKQMILPLLEYCCFLFDSGKKSKLDKIDRVQSKCIRIIENCYDKKLCVKEEILCNRFKIEPLKKRRDIQLACTMYRLSRKSMYIDSTVTRVNLRSENKIKFNCPFTKIVKIRKSPFYRGVDLWNSLKVQHHRAENKKRFKSLLRNPPT